MDPVKGLELWLHLFLISALDLGQSLISRPGRFTPSLISTGSHWISDGGPQSRAKRFGEG